MVRSIVRTAFSDDGLWFCTLAYDKSICVWEVVPSTNLAGDASLDNDEFAQTPEYFRYHLRWRKSLPTNPEACLFLPGSTHLAFTRRDDNHLQYIKLPEHSQQPDMVYSADAWEITRYNLNETLDAHISFSMWVSNSRTIKSRLRPLVVPCPVCPLRCILPSRLSVFRLIPQ